MGITLSLGACPAPPSWRKIKPEPKEPVLTEPLTATRTTDHDIQIGERILILLRAILVILLTMVLGTVGILLCILRPGGSALIPVARLWSRLILKTYGVRFRPVYDPGLDALRPYVYVANHQSQFDIPALVLSMPTDFRMVAKRELLYIPIFGWALWLAGFIFIERTDRDKAIRRLERTLSTIRRGTSVVVFAEGTRSPDGQLLPFKKGGFILAMKAGVPIVPVSIYGGHQVLPKGSLRVRPGTIHVIFGAPISTSEYSPDSSSKDVLIATVRERIMAGLEIPLATPGGSDRLSGEGSTAPNRSPVR